MCGIVGHVGKEQAAPVLIDGLRRLEYRGYDSAGLAVHTSDGIEIVRAVGKLRNLEATHNESPLQGTVGIGHTRWATHGRPIEVNAHPHVSGPVAVVHNGIIENHLDLRKSLEAEGCIFTSDTDTEIVAHLVHRRVDSGLDLKSAVLKALGQIQGAYAIAVLSEIESDIIVVAKNSSPLVLGLGDGAHYCASDIPALLPYTNRMVFMEDGELAVVKSDGVEIITLDGKPVETAEQTIDWSPVMAEKSGYKHFMLKEIFEQPRAIEDTFRGRLDREHGDVNGHEIGLSDEDAKAIKRVVFFGVRHESPRNDCWTLLG